MLISISYGNDIKIISCDDLRLLLNKNIRGVKGSDMECEIQIYNKYWIPLDDYIQTLK